MIRKAYGSNIPEARERLHGLADLLVRTNPEAAEEIRRIVRSYMHRTVNDRITPVEHVGITAEQYATAVHLLNTTDWSMQRIGNATGLNAGRISEIKNGIA